MLFIGLYVFVFRATSDTKDLLSAEIVICELSNTNQMLPSLRLKLKIMTQYSYLMSCYFIYELVVNGLIPTFENTSLELPNPINPMQPVVEQFFDLLFISGLLYVVRPRVWPANFDIGFIDALD